jgi:formate dehydrogenase subunit gamma
VDPSQRLAAAPTDRGEASGDEAAPSEAGALPEFLDRFAPPSRQLHWLVAIPVLLLLITGFTNFWPEAKALHLGGARLFAWLHVLLGFAFAAALVLALLTIAPRRATRRDARELLTVRLADYLWLQHQVLRAAGQHSVGPRVGKFNAGQKVNAALSSIAVLALTGTGLVLGVSFWRKDVFDVDMVAALFRWHTVLSVLLLPLVLGHIYMTTLNPGTRESLRGITLGRVRRAWAERHHPAWAARVLREQARPGRERDE